MEKIVVGPLSKVYIIIDIAYSTRIDLNPTYLLTIKCTSRWERRPDKMEKFADNLEKEKD